MTFIDTETTCPSCGGEIIIEYDTDGLSIWVREIWRKCSCEGIILDLLVPIGEGKGYELLIAEWRQPE